MTKKTKAAKHAARLRSDKKRRPNRISPLELPVGYMPKIIDDDLYRMAFDQMLLIVLRKTGIRDELLNIIKNAPPKNEKPETIQ